MEDIPHRKESPDMSEPREIVPRAMTARLLHPDCRSRHLGHTSALIGLSARLRMWNGHGLSRGSR